MVDVNGRGADIISVPAITYFVVKPVFATFSFDDVCYVAVYEGKDDVLQVSRTINNNGYVDMNFVFNANYRKAELERLRELGYKTLKFSYRTDNGNLTGIYNGNHTSNEEISYTAAAFERNKWIDVEISLDVIIENFDNLSLIATKFMYCPKGNYTGNTIVTNFYFTGVTLSK